MPSRCSGRTRPISSVWCKRATKNPICSSCRFADAPSTGPRQVIFAAEPDAALGDPDAVERVTLALAKISGTILATLLRRGEEALADVVSKAGEAMGQEARATAGIMRALEDDTGTDTIN